MVGAASSIMIVTVSESVPPPDVAVHVSVVPAVSAVSVVALQPEAEEMALPASVTDHDTVTSETYQPPPPSVPDTEGTIVGGVASTTEIRIRKSVFGSLLSE